MANPNTDPIAYRLLAPDARGSKSVLLFLHFPAGVFQCQYYPMGLEQNPLDSFDFPRPSGGWIDISSSDLLPLMTARAIWETFTRQGWRWDGSPTTMTGWEPLKPLVQG